MARKDQVGLTAPRLSLCLEQKQAAFAAIRLFRLFKAAAASRSAPADKFAVIERGLALLDGHGDIRCSPLERELAFGFARDVLTEMTERLDQVACQYIDDAVEASRKGNVRGLQLRAVVRAAAILPTELAVPVLTRAAHPETVLAGTEAAIFVSTSWSRSTCSAGAPTSIFAPTRHMLPSLPIWLSRLGDDLADSWRSSLNLVLTIPIRTYEKIRALFKRSFAGAPPTEDSTSSEPNSAAAVAKHFLETCDRLLFNAAPAGIRQFFANPRRAELLWVVDRLGEGEPLTLDDFSIFEPYTQSLANDIEYHVGHVLFALSSLNDFEQTLRIAEARVASFSNDTPPEEVNFFHAVLVYLHILHGRQYDDARFDRWEEMILRERPSILLYRPGLERGERRGFADTFDRVFEDGFGVIYPYGVLLPSARRKGLQFANYRREMTSPDVSPLPLYTAYLEQFLRDGRIEVATQVLQGLASVIVTWPIEGLWALRGAIGHPHPLIRRATVRVLAEAYGRHADETNQFLVASGAALTDEDTLEIKVRSDARIG